MRIIISILLILSFSFLFVPLVNAQNAESNEVVTRVGNPSDDVQTGPCNIKRVYYCQGDPRWQNRCDMTQSGCGPTSTAMILSSFGDTITPKEVDAIFQDRAYRSCGGGSVMEGAIIPRFFTEKGYTYQKVPLAGRGINLEKAKEYLDNGYLILGSTANHIFVMYGVDIPNDKVLLMDPARCENNPSVTRDNSAPWNGEAWYYAYAIKKNGCETSNPNPPIQTAGVCKGAPEAFGQVKLLPDPNDPKCQSTDTLTCGRTNACFRPSKIVMHTTVSPLDADGIYNYFAGGSGGRGVGTQFVIGKDGKIVQMVNVTDMEVEKSFGVAYYNDDSISVELAHTDIYSSKSEVPTAQYQAALTLVRKLMQQYSISKGNLEYDWVSNRDTRVNIPSGVYGHYQLNPSNRTDPGQGFLRDFRADL